MSSPNEQINPPTPLDVMLRQLNSNSANGGMTVSVKRRCTDGSLIDASANQLSTLSTKSRVATAAQALKELPPTERTAWAIEMKDYANELYATNQTRDAMEKYVEALAATNFGSQGGAGAGAGAGAGGERDNEEDNNIDVLVIPILCNLASCCIRLQEFSKALAFADQALKLRPQCGKALMRRGIALLQHAEYARSVAALTQALELVEDTPGAVLVIGQGDRLRIPILLGKAKQGLESEQRAVARRKKSLERHFGRHAPSTAATTTVAGSSDAGGDAARGIWANLRLWIIWLHMWLTSFLALASFSGKKRQ